jgi:hypothetical protein
MTKKKIFSIVCYGLIVTIFCIALIKKDKIIRYIENERYKRTFYNIFVMLGKAERCYIPQKHIIEVFNQENIDYYSEDLKITKSSLEKLSNLNLETGNLRIPLITHHIYFSFNNKLNEFYIEKMKANFSRLNAISPNWQHYIWTNKADLFPQEITEIKGVKTRFIEELSDHPLYEILSHTIEKGKKLKAYFSEASDLSRFMLLQTIGGIYNDMDYEIYNAEELLKLIKRFDFIGGRELYNRKSYYGSAFIAAKPNHPILNDLITREINNYKKLNVADYIKYPCTELDRIYFNAPPLVTLSYFKKNNIDGNNDIILPAWMIYNFDYAHYKNKTCEYNTIKKEDFIKDGLAELLSDYSKNPEIPKENKDNHNISQEDINNIYYNINKRGEFPIIGADMGCGTWVEKTNPKYWYWKE